jgi:acyl-coenzyme A synthetase/AMP-(fatty) acid ligase
VTDAAVVGLPSSKFGQIVGAILVLDKETSEEAPKVAPKVRSGQFPRNESSKTWGTLEGILKLRKLLSYRLAKHKLPQQVKIIDGPIPKNAMGKGMLLLSMFKTQLTLCLFAVDKKALARQFFGV